jgi:signal transduction histidine kinase
MNSIRQPIEVETHILSPIRRRLARYQAKEIQLVTNMNVLGNISAPRKELTHIIVHLLDNAFKFSPQGGTVELSIATNAAGDTRLRVRDEGPGIPPEFAEKVFERFFQLSQGNTREYEGLGVGLTLAKAVMEKMGGRIIILDVPSGCCIELYIPGQVPGEPAYG